MMTDTRGTVLAGSSVPHEQLADLLHPFAVDIEIVIPRACGGPEMDELGGIVEEELHVIDKLEEGDRNSTWM